MNDETNFVFRLKIFDFICIFQIFVVPLQRIFEKCAEINIFIRRDNAPEERLFLRKTNEGGRSTNYELIV